MTEEERKRYFGILVEQLYRTLQVLSESTLPNKKKEAAKVIYDFYIENKEDYKIESVQEVIQELNRVNGDMKENGIESDVRSIYTGEEPGDN